MPVNSTLIQLGFDYGLNYQFVVSQESSTHQIFSFLPQGLAYGLDISLDSIFMKALMPYDTSSNQGYVTTLAQAYVPSDQVNALQQALHAPAALLYQNPDSSVKTLMSMIDPTIPLIPGATMDQTKPTSTQNPAAGASSFVGDGSPIGGDSGNSQSVKGSSVGIGLGACAGAAAYAAAMIYVARRYRKRRQRHQRASSMTAPEGMSQISGGGMGAYFMSGARGSGGARSASSSGGRGSRHSDGSNGRSVRGQGISKPIMAENSLGWT